MVTDRTDEAMIRSGRCRPSLVRQETRSYATTMENEKPADGPRDDLAGQDVQEEMCSICKRKQLRRAQASIGTQTRVACTGVIATRNTVAPPSIENDRSAMPIAQPTYHLKQNPTDDDAHDGDNVERREKETAKREHTKRVIAQQSNRNMVAGFTIPPRAVLLEMDVYNTRKELVTITYIETDHVYMLNTFNGRGGFCI